MDDGETFILASDLTKAVAALLAITDSLCVCWLNAPVLALRHDFLRIASELLRVDQPPFLLWVGMNGKPDGGLAYTRGMAQFGAPELFIGKQSTVSKEVSRSGCALCKKQTRRRTDDRRSKLYFQGGTAGRRYFRQNGSAPNAYRTKLTTPRLNSGLARKLLLAPH